MAQNFEYKSGICNIGPLEKKYRRRVGISGTIGTIVLFSVLLLLSTPPIWRLILFLPINIALMGFYQDKSNFCVSFGIQGLYNMQNSERKITKISDAVLKHKDRVKAVKMLTLSVIVSSLITVALVFLPV